MVPYLEKQLEGTDAGNKWYAHCMNLLKKACGPFYEIAHKTTRTCQCGCTNQEKVGDHIEAVIGAAICLSGTEFEEVTQAQWDVRWKLKLKESPYIDAGIRLIFLNAAVWALNARCDDIDWQDPMSILNRGLQNCQKRGPTWKEWVLWRCTKAFKKRKSGERVLRERDKADNKRKKREGKRKPKRKRKQRKVEEETTGTSSKAQRRLQEDKLEEFQMEMVMEVSKQESLQEH